MKGNSHATLSKDELQVGGKDRGNSYENETRSPFFGLMEDAADGDKGSNCSKSRSSLFTSTTIAFPSKLGSFPTTLAYFHG